LAREGSEATTPEESEAPVEESPEAPAAEAEATVKEGVPTPPEEVASAPEEEETAALEEPVPSEVLTPAEGEPPETSAEVSPAEKEEPSPAQPTPAEAAAEGTPAAETAPTQEAEIPEGVEAKAVPPEEAAPVEEAEALQETLAKAEPTQDVSPPEATKAHPPTAIPAGTTPSPEPPSAPWGIYLGIAVVAVVGLIIALVWVWQRGEQWRDGYERYEATQAELLRLQAQQNQLRADIKTELSANLADGFGRAQESAERLNYGDALQELQNLRPWMRIGTHAQVDLGQVPAALEEAEAALKSMSPGASQKLEGLVKTTQQLVPPPKP